MNKISAHAKINNNRTINDKPLPVSSDNLITVKRPLISGDRRIQGKRIIGYETTLSGSQCIKMDNPDLEDPEIGSMQTQDVSAWSGWAAASLKRQQLKNIHELFRYTKKVKNAAQEEDETALYYEGIDIAKNHLAKTVRKKVMKIVSNQKEQRSIYEQNKKEFYKKEGDRKQKKKKLKELKEVARKQVKAKAAEKAAEKKIAATAGKAAGSAFGGVLIVLAIIAVVVIMGTGTILAITLFFYAPIPTSDRNGTEGEVIPEEDAEEFLRAYLPELRDDYIAGLQARETELRAEGYNHIVIYNLLGMSLGGDDNEDGSPSVIPANITDPDCGILSVEDYVQMLRMIFVPCLLAKYDTSYNNTEAKELAKQCFNLITYREEYPQNVDSNGIVNYVYCDGTCIPNNEYSCYAFYRDSSGRAHAWDGCLGRCWNCSTWRQHESPDADSNPCCVTRTRCPGHAVVEGEEAKFYHSNVGYCHDAVQYSVCNGFRVCYGHKEINIVIGTGSTDDLLQEYFLDRIEELERLENLTEEQRAELSALKNYYEIARMALENNMY